MKIVNHFLRLSPLLLAMSTGMNTAVAEESQMTFNGVYLSLSFASGELREISVRDAVLLDNDLIRGNDNEEAIFPVRAADSTNTSPLLPLFGGILTYDTGRPVLNDGEFSATLTFKDGTSIEQVYGIFHHSTFSYGLATINRYLFDHNALTTVGKTIWDISEITSTEFVDHDLNYSDFGFTNEEIIHPIQEEPEPVIVPPRDPSDSGINVVVGTEADDRLIGTNGADIFDARGGSRDVMRGRAGADTFVFGSDAENGIKNIDVIRDFNVNEDTIVLEQGASIAIVRERDTSITLRLTGGDRDVVRLRNADFDFDSVNIIFTEGFFEAP